jgi:putative transposase
MEQHLLCEVYKLRITIARSPTATQYNMKDGYQIRDQEGLYYLTLTTVGWIDVFSRQRYRDIIIESFKFCQAHKGLIIYAYVIMTNHIHLIAQVKNKRGLSYTLGDFKKYTSRLISQSIENEPESRRDWLQLVTEYHARTNVNNGDHKIWHWDNHPIHLYSPDFIWEKLNYIHQNPVRAGWVAESSHWLYSSASNYATGKGILEVTCLDFPMSTIGYVHLLP